ncbi:hypothetical protein HBDW_20830 [Herbaspirillum sp. DW155]|uniref:hypothetical protein n=1 Tax=Herbaspirillum sp. DW155 TaxID=3095609 RepID=UPI0030873A54|nr:hypothetical protein HBDW_20830 [Herbaspirillum sp. DW155]
MAIRLHQLAMRTAKGNAAMGLPVTVRPEVLPSGEQASILPDEHLSGGTYDGVRMVSWYKASRTSFVIHLGQG